MPSCEDIQEAIDALSLQLGYLNQQVSNLQEEIELKTTGAVGADSASWTAGGMGIPSVPLSLSSVNARIMELMQYKTSHPSEAEAVQAVIDKYAEIRLKMLSKEDYMGQADDKRTELNNWIAMRTEQNCPVP